MPLLCPNCGNLPKSPIRSFLSMGTPMFRCHECGLWIRGDLLVMSLDVLSYLASGAATAFLVFLAATRRIELTPEASLLIGMCGYFFVRQGAMWMQERYGRLHRVKNRP